MWIWIYYGAMAAGLPIAEGCTWEQIVSAADAALSGYTMFLSNCWVDGINHIVYMVYMPFTLQ